jgi:hypothetical protein
MPEMSGRNLIQKMFSISPNLKCLFMLGYTPMSSLTGAYWPTDNQSKGGGFDRRRKLRDESCGFLSVIFGVGGGIFPILKSTKRQARGKCLL